MQDVIKQLLEKYYLGETSLEEENELEESIQEPGVSTKDLVNSGSLDLNGCDRSILEDSPMHLTDRSGSEGNIVELLIQCVWRFAQFFLENLSDSLFGKSGDAVQQIE